MALQFRAVIPYTLSGVLAIIGWWWFFSRKKNRSSNQSGCPVANEQDQRTKTILAEDLIGETSPLLQQNQDEITQSCIVSKSLPFGIDSKLPTFVNSSGSKIGEEHILNSERLLSEDVLSTEIGVLDGASNFHKSSLSNPLKPSSFESAQELHYMEKNLFHKIENEVYKEVQNKTIDLNYPEDGSLNSAIVPTVEDEMGDNICNVTVHGKLTESKALSPTERAICVHGDSNFNIYELGEVTPDEKIKLSFGEQEGQKTSVAKEITCPPACSTIDSPVSVIEAMLEVEAQYTDLEKISSSDVALKIIKESAVEHSECSEISCSYNAAQSVFLHGEAGQHTGCNDIIPASHPATLEANLVCYTECSGNISVDACDQIVIQERIFQTTEARDVLSTDCIVHTLINKEAVCCTRPEGVATNIDDLALLQDEAYKCMEVSAPNLVDEGHTIVPQETALQAAKIDVYSCYKAVTPVIEESASSFMEPKEMDNADDTVHTELATALQLPEFDEISIKKDVTQPCADPIRKHSPPCMYSKVINTVVQNALPLERDAKAATFVDPLTADQGSPIWFLSNKDLSTDLTKISCSQVSTKGLVENPITCAELPTIVPKDAITSGMVQSTESSSITSTGEAAQYELRKHYFDGNAIHTPALDVGMNLDISLSDNPKESIVVGMLMNSYVESPPLLKEENLCEPTAFSLCPWKGQQLEGTEAEEDNLQMAKEMDFAKREAEAIEQLAMRIVSQVILAATREILSSAIVDFSVASCEVIENKEGSSLGLENGIALPCQISGVVNVLESNMHDNIAKNQTVGISLLVEHRTDDTSNLNASENLLSSPKKAMLKESKPKHSIETDCNEPKDSVSPTLRESSDPNITAEDSGCSACMSEDGINVEDPLQSTGLSTTVSAVELFDSLNTSGIAESNTEHSVLTVDTLKSSNLQGTINEPNGNGEIKNYPEVTQERPWSTETEADHSGGSDVNSMDSVDSGCALGKTESKQDTKPGLESKKSDLTVWEVEVPKHLVGRLIGKQGRYVSFLKQTSGAKIYISTLPYTQEFQICHIEGTQLQVDKALNQIGKKFKELNLTNIYAPPPLTLPSLPMTSWLMLPDGVTVEVIVVNVVNAGHMFVQQHTHPTFHALRSLDQQMFLCYSQPGIPVLPTPVEVGVICAAPAGDKAWWRAQVVSFYKEINEVEIRYVDYGGYERVKIEILRQIRSDFVTLPFQGSEVLLDNVIPLPDEDHFSSEADVTVSEMTRGTALLAQVTNYDASTGLPLIQLWSMLGDEVVSINRALVERGFAQWIDGY